jgi:hypothetical protein
MRKLEKLLTSMADSIQKSQNTCSRYYKIKGLTVRLSDHLTYHKSFHIQIIIPHNKCHKYCVCIGNGTKVVIWDYKQIIEFLPTLTFVKEMQTVKNVSVLPAQKLLKTKLVQIDHSERKIISRLKSPLKSEEIEILKQLLFKEFNRTDGLNEDLISALMTYHVTYREILTLYHLLIIENDVIPDSENIKAAMKVIATYEK